MDELAQWLDEQLNIDAGHAQEAAAVLGSYWSAQSLRSGRRKPRHYVGASTEARISRSNEEILSGSEAVVRHAAVHDPARVLREIDAKRKLLDDYVVTAHIRDEAAARIKAAGDYPNPKDLEDWDRAQREAAILEGPVRLAASPLSHRPGYREEWRP